MKNEHTEDEQRQTKYVITQLVTSKRHRRYGFQLSSVVDGNNTDAKLWLGGSLDIPFTLFGGKP